ncbi:MAG: flagellar biosynthetic protein FliO, partial [Planctomycetota bacterium]|nr:flagellar biosynthetic protein FliO [Planctomycetota bacterium]
DAAPKETPPAGPVKTESTDPKPAAPEGIEATPLTVDIPASRAEGTGARDDLAGVGWTALWTVAVIAAIFLCFFVVRRLLPGSRFFFPSDAITILARRNIAPNAALFLVQMGRKILRIGLSKDNIAFLGEVTDPDEASYIRSLGPGGKKDSVAREFDEELKLAVEGKGTGEAEADIRPEVEQVQNLKDEIARIRTVIEGWKSK